MAYGSGHCPQCGVKFNVNKSSIGTMRRCIACGAKFIVQAPPAPVRAARSGCGCLSITFGAVIGGGLLLVAVCGGLAVLSNNQRPTIPPANGNTASKPIAKPAAPPPMASAPPKVNEPPINVAALCGLTIDKVRKVLGPPKDATPEPTKEQVKVGIDEWENVFEKSGHELLVTFSAKNRRVVDFFISGVSIPDIEREWGLDAKSEKYRLVPVKALRGDGFTGLKITPTALALESAKEPEPPPPEPQLTDVRTWTSQNGKYTTEAKYAGMIGETVLLKKTDGTTAKLKLDQLSPADREWIEAARKKKH